MAFSKADLYVDAIACVYNHENTSGHLLDCSSDSLYTELFILMTRTQIEMALQSLKEALYSLKSHSPSLSSHISYLTGSCIKT